MGALLECASGGKPPALRMFLASAIPLERKKALCLGHRAFNLVAGAGFEPAAFRL